MRTIDHVFTVVADLAQAAKALRALGFTVTDRGDHTGRGTANHLVTLPGFYWEVVGVTTPMASNAMFNRPGRFGCALATQDIEADCAALGIPSGEIAPLKRPIEIEGVSHEAAFRTALITTLSPDDGFFFFCQHLTPDLVFRPEMTAHANGAQRVAGFDLIAEDAGPALDLMENIFGVRAATRDPAAFQLGAQTVRVLSPEQFQATYPGVEAVEAPTPRLGAVRFAVADLARTGFGANSDGARLHPSQEGWFTAPESLGGTVLAFTTGS